MNIYHCDENLKLWWKLMTCIRFIRALNIYHYDESFSLWLKIGHYNKNCQSDEIYHFDNWLFYQFDENLALC